MGSKEMICSLLPGMPVFVRDLTEVWLEGTISRISKTTCTVFVISRQESREYPLDAVLQKSEQCLKEVNSLTDLSPINQASVLCCLHERFEEKKLYTNAGSTIVAVNPFRKVEDIYSLQTLLTYHTGLEDSPHIYKVGSEAYSRLCRGIGNVNQCIVVSGESGSGKTVTAKHLLRYMTVVSNSESGERHTSLGVCESVEQRLLDSNPVLESFGNAVTQRNDNSSRFGKFIQLQFSRGGQMLGGEIQTYLLEKTRVVHQLAGEANFHIFYQIMESLHQSEDTVLGRLVHEIGEDAFKVLPARKCIDGNRDFQETLQAMTQIGIPEETQADLTKVLVAILFLCNVEITPVEDDLCQLLQDKDDRFLDTGFIDLEVSETSLKQAAELLGLETSHIEQVLLYRNIQSGGNKRRSMFIKPVPEREAYSRRDCLATFIYSRLFEWLVGFINKQIHRARHDYTIGLLDIYGFEAFETNSLEQLCINYANEKLQQHYVTHFLKDLQKVYEDECINWQHLPYCDNQACLDVLEGQPSVFGLLNEDVHLNRQTNTVSLCERILALSKASSSYVKRPKCFMKNPGFTIHHYAGDVTYTGEGLSTKNRDNIPQELVCMLQSSSNNFVSQLFDEYVTEEQHGRKRKTVLGKFKASLDCLMSSLTTSDVHYIRCIKPNTRSVPCVFDRPYVMAQLTACGIIETVKISSLGYPVRMPFTLFLQRYGLIIRNSSTPPQSDTETVCDSDALYEPLDILYRKQLDISSVDSSRRSTTPRRRLRRRAVLSSADHTRRCSAAVLSLQFGRCQGLTQQFGKTKLFLHQYQVDSLEQKRFDILSSKATVLQLAWERYKLRCAAKQRRRQNVAARKIQCVWGRYRKHKRVKAVIVLQKTFRRMHIARERYHELQRKKGEPISNKKSCKPILDRKRTSPGTERSQRASRRSNEFINRSDSSDCSIGSASSERSSTRGDSTERPENCLRPFTVSTPQADIRISMSPESTVLKPRRSRENNKENLDRLRRNPKGRPNMSPVNSQRFNCRTLATKRMTSSVSMETGSEGDQEEGASPKKKQKLSAFNHGDGILTRRSLPKVPVRFHTRASVLKYAHYMQQKVTPTGLMDCLPCNQSEGVTKNTLQ